MQFFAYSTFKSTKNALKNHRCASNELSYAQYKCVLSYDRNIIMLLSHNEFQFECMESRPAILKYLSFYYSDVFQHFFFVSQKTNGIWQGEERVHNGSREPLESRYWEAGCGRE